MSIFVDLLLLIIKRKKIIMDGDVIGIIIAVGYVLFRYVVKAIGDAEKEGRDVDVKEPHTSEPPFVEVDERTQKHYGPASSPNSADRSYILGQLVEGVRSTKSPSARKKVRKLSHPEQSAKRSGTTHLQKMLHSSEGARRAFLMSEIFRRVY